jgi:hypothetical protein
MRAMLRSRYKIFNLRSPYVERGWTWSAMHGEWLQQEHPNMTAHSRS